jgi:small redox-active disulfide protein 2
MVEMKVKVLGPGCPKCNKLYNEAAKAVAASGVDADLEKVDKIEDIMSYGVMMTPALVIDEEVKSVGKVVKADEIASWLAITASKEG